MKISKEVRVGIVSIFAIGILVWGYNYLKGSNFFYKSTSVYAVYPKVPGLSVSAPIIINGVQSGIVEGIYFHPNKSSNVIVKLSISETGLMIPNNSIAELISVDFMGSKAIGIKLGDSNVNLEPGDTLKVDFEPSMLEGFSEQILPIKDELETMMDTLKVATTSFTLLMDNFNDVLDERRKRDLQKAISGLKTTMESFDMLATDMSKMMKNDVRPVLKTYKSLGDSIKGWEVNTTLLKAQSTLDSLTLMLSNINKGQGTMGKLMTNDSLYNNMNNATKQMDELLEDIKLHPKRYFRVLSKKEIPYKEN
jgi:phospholipid/cholesterol/gamma-HCH transport system substrate-binding protein